MECCMYAKCAARGKSLRRHQEVAHIQEESCTLGDQQKYGTCCPWQDVTFKGRHSGAATEARF